MERREVTLETASSIRIRRTRRWALAILVLSGAVNYIDRSTLAIANPLIRQDLGLSISEMGLLLSAFLWAYAFAQLPTGVMVDRLGSRILLSMGVTIWSVAQLCGGLVQSFTHFFFARMMLGIGEAPQFTVGVRVVRDWYNIRERGLPTGLFLCATALGQAIAPPLLTVLMLSFGWRSMFVIMGVVGLVVAVIWFTFYRDPQARGLTQDEVAYLSVGDEERESHPVRFSEWRELLRMRSTWGMLLGYFGLLYMLWMFAAWLPNYLQMDRHISIATTGIAAAVPFLFGVGGSVFGGWITDVFVSLGFSPINSRKIPFVACVLSMAGFTLVAAEVASNNLAIAFISVAHLFGFAANATAWAMPSVIAPFNRTSSLASMQNFGGYIGAALAPTVTGFIVQASGSFFSALVTSVCVGTVSAIIYLLMVNQPAKGDKRSSISVAY